MPFIEGISFPAVGFGTYPLKGDACFRAVMQAAKLGYRIIDTATFYKNLTDIGNALKTLGRENFYINSKVWPDDQTPVRLREDIKMTLSQLQTTYLDGYLLHWPNSKIPLEDTLGTMEELRMAGMIRHIGLSNVNVNHLKRALELRIPLTWVQVEMHPFFYDPILLEFCQENSITIQAWAPLARGRVSEDSTLNRLGKKYAKTAAQIALKWIVQHQCIPLPASQNEKHMSQNQDINDFILSPADIDEINNKANTGNSKRLRITQANGLGFTDEFDFSYEECWPKSRSF